MATDSPQHAAGPRDSSRGLLSYLTLELYIEVLEHLRPLGSLTTNKSNAVKPEIRQGHVESRSDFANLCLVSKLHRPYATRYLYQTVLLKDQKELLYFFRTMASNPDLRPGVRSFAWAGVLSTDNTNAKSTRRRNAEMASLAPDCWASIGDWPSTPTGADIARLMSIDGPGTLQTWRVLGAVLAMIPRTRSLFMLQSHGERSLPKQPSCPEQEAIRYLLLQDNNPRFLQELETITLEPHEQRRTPCFATAPSLMALLLNSPSVRRVELKGPFFFRSVRVFAEKFWFNRVVSESVRELLHFRPAEVDDDQVGLLTTFPKLVSLEAEYNAGHFLFAQSNSTTFSEALCTVSGTLETLSLTTAPGSFWNGNIVLPLLPPLHQMAALKHLTTESIWLFGRQDLLSTPRLVNVLPRSLSCLRLIDYWGSSDVSIFGPLAPSSSNLLELYDRAFSGLHYNWSTHLPNLKSIVLQVSDPSQPHTATESGSSSRDLPADARAFELKFQALFAGLGVRFSIFASDMSDVQRRSSWANVG